MKPKTAIAACRQILKKSGSSFALAFNVIPPDHRNAMTAFYAFCRCVDDAVDDAVDSTAARQSLEEWKNKIGMVFEGQPQDQICEALCWTVDRFGVKREHLDLILEGVEQDLQVNRYAGFADLYEYCYRVASAVGLTCITILGEDSAEASLYAELTGIAVQLTNILRDVGEDARLGRIYIPQDDLLAFRVAEDDLVAGRMTRNLKKLLHFEANRAQCYYDLAAGALGHKMRHRLFFPEALRQTYRQLLDKLIEEDFPVFKRRISVGKAKKISIALRHRFHPATFIGGLR
jgi:15-cis-phytoene synthase